MKTGQIWFNIRGVLSSTPIWLGIQRLRRRGKCRLCN